MAEKKAGYLYVKDAVALYQERLSSLEERIKTAYQNRIDFPTDSRQMPIAGRIYTQEMGPLFQAAFKLKEKLTALMSPNEFGQFLDEEGKIRRDSPVGQEISRALETWNQQVTALNKTLEQTVKTINHEIKGGWNPVEQKWNPPSSEPKWDLTKPWILHLNKPLEKMDTQLAHLKEDIKTIYHQTPQDSPEQREQFARIIKPITTRLSKLIEERHTLQQVTQGIPQQAVVVGTKRYHEIMDHIEEWKKDYTALNILVKDTLGTNLALTRQAPGLDIRDAPTQVDLPVEIDDVLNPDPSDWDPMK